MKKAKFWMLQLMMLGLFSLISGSPILADDESYDDNDRRWHQKLQHDEDGFNDQRWHEKFDAKEVKKTKKHEKKLAKIPAKYNSQKRVDKENKENEKFSKWQEKHEKKLTKHNAKHHANVVPEVQPADEPVCISWFNGVCVAYAN